MSAIPPPVSCPVLSLRWSRLDLDKSTINLRFSPVAVRATSLSVIKLQYLD